MIARLRSRWAQGFAVTIAVGEHLQDMAEDEPLRAHIRAGLRGDAPPCPCRVPACPGPYPVPRRCVRGRRVWGLGLWVVLRRRGAGTTGGPTSSWCWDHGWSHRAYFTRQTRVCWLHAASIQRQSHRYCTDAACSQHKCAVITQPCLGRIARRCEEIVGWAIAGRLDRHRSFDPSESSRHHSSIRYSIKGLDREASRWQARRAIPTCV